MIFAFSAEYLCNLTPAPPPNLPFMAFQWKKEFAFQFTSDCWMHSGCLRENCLLSGEFGYICEIKERLVHKWWRTLNGKVNLLFKRWDCDLRYPIKAKCAETLTASSFKPLTASSAPTPRWFDFPSPLWAFCLCRNKFKAFNNASMRCAWARENFFPNSAKYRNRSPTHNESKQIIFSSHHRRNQSVLMYCLRKLSSHFC